MQFGAAWGGNEGFGETSQEKGERPTQSPCGENRFPGLIPLPHRPFSPIWNFPAQIIAEMIRPLTVALSVS